MRILIISDAWHPQINGVVRTYEHLTAHLEQLGHTTNVIGPDQFKSTAMPGYNEIRLSLFPKRKLELLINEFSPDHIHIAVEGPLGLAARKICSKQNRSYTTCYHSHFPDYIAKRCAWMGKNISQIIKQRVIDYVRWFHKDSKCVFVATDSLEQTLRNWGFKTPMARLVRGVNQDIFFPATSPSNNHEKPVLLYVGRVASEKNIADFLSLKIDAQKIVVGGGPELESLKKQYPNVEYAGYKTGAELADYYRQANVFVFPSKTDTFGMVLIEALACGAPIAAYPVTGPIDIITKDYLGSLDNDLSKAVTKALEIKKTSHDSLRANHIKEHYNWNAIAQVFEGTIENINDGHAEYRPQRLNKVLQPN